MEFRKAKKVVIITEAVIFDKVVDLITSLGAKGYTAQSATGKGDRGVRSGGAVFGDLFKNVRIEVITTEEIAKKIATTVIEKFFRDFAGIVYLEDVEVIRAEKFQIT